jgi:hypothetical protein
MPKGLLLALTLLFSTIWLQAQAQYPQNQNRQPGSSQTGADSSSQTTVRGCLQSSDGNYLLTDKSGTTYQLQGETSKLSEHVGHEVQITGSNLSSSATSSSTRTSAGGAQHADCQAGQAHIKNLQVQ